MVKGLGGRTLEVDLLTSCITLDILVHLSVPPFLHL